MTHFQTVLAEVFERRAERRIADPAEESRLIAAAKEGDEAATIALVYAYAPTLRALASRYAPTLGVEESRSVAVAGLLEAVAAYDASLDVTEGARSSAGLAGTLRAYVTDALAEAAGSTVAVTIPARTLKRYFGVLRRAGGDVAKAAAIAPDHDLSRESFHAIHDALRAWDSLDGSARDEEDGVTLVVSTSSLWAEDHAFADAEDRILVEHAFSAVGDLEKDVTRAAYGFSSYRPKSDAEIAGDFGLSRPTVQRTRTGALVKMRDALAVDVEV